MAFGTYESLGEVMSAVQVQLRPERFVQPRARPVDERSPEPSCTDLDFA